jgi:hypothetical protein
MDLDAVRRADAALRPSVYGRGECLWEGRRTARESNFLTHPCWLWKGNFVNCPIAAIQFQGPFELASK